MKETHVAVTAEKFQEFQSLPIEGAFQMLNLLKFKIEVDDTDVSGAQAYAEYMNAVLPFFQASKAKVVYQGNPQFAMIGPDEKEWDKVLIVEYADKADFLKMITTEGYPAHLRHRALEDSRLILCTK